ncbi:MAG: FtsW/RodA/SpoVE family cell cycle protein [Alphaproteobacteria bacterium]|nr:FtsW/RodA/SpoVE family cell cycle protein [Alphaproteobacteria bacterium]
MFDFKIDRTDQSIFGRWYLSVDKILVTLLLFLFIIGLVVSYAATPAVSEHLNLEADFMVKHQFFFLIVAFLLMIAISMLSHEQILLCAASIFLIMLIFMVAVLFKGSNAKGATRWLYMYGFCLQPSEFIKPTFAIMLASIIHYGKLYTKGIRYLYVASFTFLIIAVLLIMQPDFGMTTTVFAIFAAELLVNGLSKKGVLSLIIIGLLGLTAAYLFLPHVRIRVNGFINPEQTYQVKMAYAAIKHGGFFGVGPGNGTLKTILPDAHTDFVMAVIAEENGVLFVFGLLLLFCYIVVRSLRIAFYQNHSLFTNLAITGLMAQLSFQVFINSASTLNLIPPKGMTLPFLSYGGSSLISMGLAMGFVLGLTREKNN